MGWERGRAWDPSPLAGFLVASPWRSCPGPRSSSISFSRRSYIALIPSSHPRSSGRSRPASLGPPSPLASSSSSRWPFWDGPLAALLGNSLKIEPEGSVEAGRAVWSLRGGDFAATLLSSNFYGVCFLGADDARALPGGRRCVEGAGSLGV